jgi:hypothetical protein
VECDEEKVCERGICVQNCGCRACADTQACHSDGRCVDLGCENKTCEAGQVCVAGTCLDACMGAACPGNAECATGVCGEPAAGAIPGAGSGATSSTGGGISIDINPPGAGGSVGMGTVPPASGAAAPGPAVRGRRGSAQESGCALSGDGSAGTPVAVGALSLALLGLARRLRSSRERRRIAQSHGRS